jgi:APA family basic amino acid/polyamine antiporter
VTIESAQSPRRSPIGRLFLRKSVDQIQSEYDRSELKRTLGPVNLVLLGIGCIIGAGIFVRTGNAAALHAGPAVMLSFVVAGLVCAFAGLCYAELASALPVSGSAYTYSYTTLGEFPAWLMGSLLLLEYGLAASVVAVGWSGYVVSFLHDIQLIIPPELTQPMGKALLLQATNFSITDPHLVLGGVQATLADGSLVQFSGSSEVILPGVHGGVLPPDTTLNAVADGYALSASAGLPLGETATLPLLSEARALPVLADGGFGAALDLPAGTEVTLAAGAEPSLSTGTAISLEAGAAVANGMMNLPAAVVVLMMTGLLVFGVSESATVNNIIVAIKVTVIVAFIAIGALFVNPDNWVPFIPEPTGEPGKFGVDGVMRAASIVFFAYIGFEAVSTAGQEAKNPKRDLPIGILGSLVVCTILYMGTAAVLTGVMNYTLLDDPAPVAKAVDEFGPQWRWFAMAIKIGAIAGLTSVILVLMYGQTRIFYTMSRDGLLPSGFARIHPVFKTPWLNTLIVGVLVALAATVFDINTLGDLTSVGTLAAFAIVCVSVMWLRQARPDLPRSFKVPFYPITPILGILSCVYLITTVEMRVLQFFVWFVLGAVIVYFLYGIRKSKLAHGERVVGHEPPAMDLPHPDPKP